MDGIKVWLSDNLINIIVPIFCAFLSNRLTVQYERKKKRSEEQSSEIESLKSRLDIYEATEPSQTGEFLVRKEAGEAICPICWRNDHKAIPIYGDAETGYYTCKKCKNTGVYNHELVRRLAFEQEQANREIWGSIYDE